MKDPHIIALDIKKPPQSTGVNSPFTLSRRFGMVHTISIHKTKNSTDRIDNLPPHNLEIPAKITGGIITISIPTSVDPSYIHSPKNHIKKTAEIYR
tara:strand:- start:3 stop:290 length:288 start_codon:yes stop_codon:yes gene_type:complete